jgi:hypothetical protein
MTRLDLGVTVAMMILGFTVTFALLRSPHLPSASAAPSTTGPTTSWQDSSPGATGTVASGSANVTAPETPASMAASGAAIEPPPADARGLPLPVMLAVSAHPGPRQQAVDGDTAPGVARQVDVVNTSGELLNLTVMAVDLPTQAMTSAQLLVPPNGQAHVGSESGLKLEPGSAVTLRSRGYQEVTTTVP